MTVIKLPPHSTEGQPLGEIELDQDHWLASRLAWLALPGQVQLKTAGFALANNVGFYNDTNGTTGPHGPDATPFSSNGSIYYQNPGLLGERGVFTIFVLSAPVSASQYRRPLFFFGNESSPPFNQLNLVTNCDSATTAAPGNLAYFEYNLNRGGFVAQADATPGVVDGNWHLFCAVSNGTNVRLYVDGVDVTTSSPARTSFTENRADSYITLHGAVGLGRGAQSPCALAGVTYDALTAEEVAQLSQDPWGAISPQTRRYFALSAGGGAATVSPTGISSGEAFGTAVLTRRSTRQITATGIASAEAFGIAVITRRAVRQVTATSIASSEAFGTATLTRRAVRTVSAASIATSEAFGTAVLTRTTLRQVSPASIPSAEAFGTATVSKLTPGTVNVPSIPSAEAFGTAVLTRGFTTSITPSGILSAEAFGTTIVRRRNINPISIASGEAFGVPTITGSLPQIVSPVGIPSAQAFGVPIIFDPNASGTRRSRKHRFSVYLGA